MDMVCCDTLADISHKNATWISSYKVKTERWGRDTSSVGSFTPHPPFHSVCPPLHCHLYLFMQLLCPPLQDIPVWLRASLGLVCFHPHLCTVLILSRSAGYTDMTIITGSYLQFFSVHVWYGTPEAIWSTSYVFVLSIWMRFKYVL